MAATAVNYIDRIFDNTSKEEIEYAQRDGNPLNATVFTPVSISGAPVGDKKKPVVIVLHPGGGNYTDPATQTWAREEFAGRGYIGIAAEYKFTKGDFTPELQRQAVINVLCLARFIRLNKERFGARGSNILLFGTSAGAITAGQTNLAQNNLDDPYFEDRLNTLYTTFPDGTKISNRISGSGTKAGAATDVFLKFLDEKDSPWYDYHGMLDVKVNYAQAVKTIDQMKALRIDSSLMSFADTAHSVGHQEEIIADLIPKFAALLKS